MDKTKLTPELLGVSYCKTCGSVGTIVEIGSCCRISEWIRLGGLWEHSMADHQQQFVRYFRVDLTSDAIDLIIAHAYDENLEPRNRLQGVIARLRQLKNAAPQAEAPDTVQSPAQGERSGPAVAAPSGDQGAPSSTEQVNAGAAAFLQWCVDHEGECLGDHPVKMDEALALLAANSCDGKQHTLVTAVPAPSSTAKPVAWLIERPRGTGKQQTIEREVVLSPLTDDTFMDEGDVAWPLYRCAEPEAMPSEAEPSFFYCKMQCLAQCEVCAAYSPHGTKEKP